MDASDAVAGAVAGAVVGFLLLAASVVAVVMVIIFLQWRKKKGTKNLQLGMVSKYVLAYFCTSCIAHNGVSMFKYISYSVLV